MIDGEDFVFGQGYMNRRKTHVWNPDRAPNPSLMILGESGSGKTRLLKQALSYLQHRQKHIFVIDLHGDISVDNENYLEFTARNSKYGINPFEFEICVKNGGPAVQRDEMVRMLKKSVWPNMGSKQEMIIKRLIMDAYRAVGICEEDENTWTNELPTIASMYELLNAIRTIVTSGLSADLNKAMDAAEKKVRKKEDEKKNILHQLDRLSERDPKLEMKVEALTTEIGRILSSLDGDWEDYKLSRIYGSQVEETSPTDIEYDFYRQKDVMKLLDNINVYLTSLVETGVFNNNIPPVRSGLNRFNIKGLSHDAQVFFAEVLMQKVFRSKQLKGEYRLKADKSRGEAVDTYIVIDEGKNLLSGKNKEDPLNITNKIVTEARKYGLGIIIVSQRAHHFSQEMLSNICFKVVLKTAANDIPGVKKYLGIKDESLFKMAENSGIALISNDGKTDYKPVALPWAKKIS